jgi:glycosyltransferase involved in cell wall biosynthesis
VYNGSMRRVSVLMPVYNAAATLDEALESLAGQSLQDFEIVAVDDGSTDATPQKLEAWARREARLRVIRQEHAGIIQALNNGLEACQSELVARMDADDRSYPNRLELQAALVENRPELAAVSCLVAGFPEDKVREGFRIYIEWLNSLVEQADIRREMFVESPLAHPSVMFRRSVVQRAGGYEEHGWPEDYDLWLRLYLQGERFEKTPQVLLDWREAPQRMTRTDSRYSLENFLRAKAYYLARGPLAGRKTLFIWGAGMMGRRLAKQLERQEWHPAAFIDVDPRKIGRTKRGQPVIGPHELMKWWGRAERPVLLAAVGARGARALIRQQLDEFGLCEGKDWWGAA